MREKTFFGFDWQFALTDSRNFPARNTQWRAVQLPHDWPVDEPVLYLRPHLNLQPGSLDPLI